MFNSQRFKVARERRGFTKKNLSEISGVTTRTISKYENSEYLDLDSIEMQTMEKLSYALEYPIDFFFKESVQILNTDGVSFRAMTKISAAKRDSALAAGTIGIELNSWLESKFKLPKPDLLDFSNESFTEPQIAADSLREHWGLGQLSISNMIHLLESKGIRVYSLAENCIEVDAFSFWLDGKPFVFLNTMKSPERSRFDAAHELAHLVLHKHSSNNGRSAEEQADKFASAFLMPKDTILASTPNYPSLKNLLKLKALWKVSLSALIRRTFDLGISSEWHYRQLNIELSSTYGRKSEPEGINDQDRETSLILDKVFNALRNKGFKRSNLVDELQIPVDELSAITFNNPFLSMKVISNLSVLNEKAEHKQVLLRVV